MTKPYSVKFEPNIPIVLRDGTTTYADIFRPDVNDKFPGLLHRTPYDKRSAQSTIGDIDAIHAAMEGYAVVIQDIRGRILSDGEFYTFVNEIDDGYDSVEWVAAQPWCSGKVGMYGTSYVGATQWLAAIAKPPSLVAIAPGVTASNYHDGWVWQGGAFELGFSLSWASMLAAGNWTHPSRAKLLSLSQQEAITAAQEDLMSCYNYLPLQDITHLERDVAPYYLDWLSHPDYDEYWKKISIEEFHAMIDIPAFNYGGWQDIFLKGTIRNFVGMNRLGGSDEARKGQRLVIGPWDHNNANKEGGAIIGGYDFGSSSSGAAVGLQGLLLNFFDYWLKGENNGIINEKPIQIFVMGENVWRLEDEWPLKRAVDVNYYLHSEGKANTLNGDGILNPEMPLSEPTDTYLYNPMNPVPTSGGGLCCDAINLGSGVHNQKCVEERSDILVYSTPPLDHDTEVTGPITVTLFASSSAQDTDFTGKLVDVDPCGFARNLTDGIIRARYRQGSEKPELIEAHKIYEYKIDLWATSNVFKKGHQIRLEISSSNFPRFDRNTNTGNPIGEDKEFIAAMQTIHHSNNYPSHITLPTIPKT